MKRNKNYHYFKSQTRAKEQIVKRQPAISAVFAGLVTTFASQKTSMGNYKILVTGAAGQLGSEFQVQQYVYPDLDFLFQSSADLNICDSEAFREKVEDFQPNAIINCAAYTNVEKAEDDPDLSMKINALCLGPMAALCKEKNILLVHFSTDYVFDGVKGRAYVEEDSTEPLNHYGVTKREGERVIVGSGCDFLIFRISWLYSTFGHNFYKTMLRLAHEKGALSVVADQISTPTYARHLAHDVLEAIEMRFEGKKIPSGIYHYSHIGETSWFGFAKEIMINKMPHIPVNATKTVEFPTKAVRPPYSKLNAEKFFSVTGIEPYSWKTALADCISNDIAQTHQQINPMIENTIVRAEQWFDPLVDPTTQEEVQRLIETGGDELLEAFYSDLEFGTGGLRGIMGVGTARMNLYTISFATQGLANYLKKVVAKNDIRVAIAFDSRNNSPEFAKQAATILSANGIHAMVFEALRPTPLLSFAVRKLSCDAGLVITASHNPPEYNGYKVYWNDGAQVLPPHDERMIAEVRMIKGFSQVNWTGNAGLISTIPSSVEESYLHALKNIIANPQAIVSSEDLKIVYTSIHGAGITMVPKALRSVGFTAVTTVAEQEEPNGNFPTVASPNPEEAEAMKMALELGEKLNAEIVLGTDPDTDRVGIAVRNHQGQLVLLNGNQAAALIVYYQLVMRKEKGLSNEGNFIAKTIVTSEIIDAMCERFNIKVYNTLTGFKYIAGVMRELEGSENFIAGGEESYGYLVGDFVRDKDAVLSSVVLCEIAAWCKAKGQTVWDLLMTIYCEFGFYHEKLLSITIKGFGGIEKINQMMDKLRLDPPAAIGGVDVREIRDISKGTSTDIKTGQVNHLNLPSSNVLQFILDDGTKVSARPSGTEPKIKFYFSIREKMSDKSEYEKLFETADKRIVDIREQLIPAN